MKFKFLQLPEMKNSPNSKPKLGMNFKLFLDTSQKQLVLCDARITFPKMGFKFI